MRLGSRYIVGFAPCCALMRRPRDGSYRRGGSPPRRPPPTDPQDPIPPQSVARAQGAQYLTRARRKSRGNGGRMRPQRCAIPARVLDDHDQPDWPPMHLRQLSPLQVASSELRLEIRRHPLDFAGQDLRGTEQHEVDRPPMIAHAKLHARLPRSVRLCLDVLDDGQLSRITERGLTARVCAQHEVEADGLRYGAQCADADRWVTSLRPPGGRPGNASTVGNLLERHSQRGPCQPQLIADPPALPLTSDAARRGPRSPPSHWISIGPGAYRPITTRSIEPATPERQSALHCRGVSRTHVHERRPGARHMLRHPRCIAGTARRIWFR